VLVSLFLGGHSLPRWWRALGPPAERLAAGLERRLWVLVRRITTRREESRAERSRVALTEEDPRVSRAPEDTRALGEVRVDFLSRSVGDEGASLAGGRYNLGAGHGFNGDVATNAEKSNARLFRQAPAQVKCQPDRSCQVKKQTLKARGTSWRRVSLAN